MKFKQLRSSLTALAINPFALLMALVPATVSAQPLPDSKETLAIESTSFQIPVPAQKELKGGHLQGIQLHHGTLMVSGSSEKFGYLAVFQKLGEDFRFLGVKNLAAQPLNHAGGFQLAENWLAIGLEDPRGKRRSIIQLIDVSSFQSLSEPPVFTLERKGEPKVSTAGAVALLKRKDHFLLAVGTWDCKTIDLYTSNGIDPRAEGFTFEKWTRWDSREAKKKDWVSKELGNYQNLQLSEDSTGVYLSGFARSKNGSNTADVFRLRTEADPYTLLQKIGSYSVQCKGDITFRNGAGFANYNGKSSITAVGHNLWPKTQVQIFPIQFK